jgi:hypothetical protein
MKNSKTREQFKFWKQRLAEYQRKYDGLKKQSPDRWWHDEYFDNQLRVLETLILGVKERIKELKKK